MLPLSGRSAVLQAVRLKAVLLLRSYFRLRPVPVIKLSKIIVNDINEQVQSLLQGWLACMWLLNVADMTGGDAAK